MESTSEAVASGQDTNDLGHVIFFYIPISRLIFMSILSCGVYEAYWIYKNWSYLKNRDHRYHIEPFWRGWMGIFYCHSLLKTMHADRELRIEGAPRFAPKLLATIWVILILTAYAMGHNPSVNLEETMIALIIPSCLCFVPIQLHVNRVNRKVDPCANYAKWTKGHIVCLVAGLLIWGRMLLGIGMD
ncbi:MAG: hypothetical protein PF495_12235 [Spirochaetales bacterium]|jgi:hypothetical protein|nr:hypothetical protein [Spirochaetales bacterium]